MPVVMLPHQKRNPLMALGLSFFFPGLGQIYNGQVAKGIFIFFTCFLILPWIFGIFDAFFTAIKINRGEIVTYPSVVLLSGCLLVISLCIFGPIIIMKVFKSQIQIYSDQVKMTKVKNTLMLVADAAEIYRKDKGAYPETFSDLYFAQPPYLNDLYCEVSTGGYQYHCLFSKEGYTITAVPETKTNNGLMTFIITTGGILNSDP